MFKRFRLPLRVTIHSLILIAMLGASNASFAQSTIEPDQAKAFIRAAMAVSLVNGTWEPRINRAKSEAEAERLREQAAGAIRRAIREVDGMTVREYRSMYYEARRDPELAAYLSDLLEQEVEAARR